MTMPLINGDTVRVVKELYPDDPRVGKNGTVVSYTAPYFSVVVDGYAGKSSYRREEISFVRANASLRNDRDTPSTNPADSVEDIHVTVARLEKKIDALAAAFEKFVESAAEGFNGVDTALSGEPVVVNVTINNTGE